MHPGISLGDNQNCNYSNLHSCAPSYRTLSDAGKLWRCPAGAVGRGKCGSGSECVMGSGANPLCHTLNASSPCCCPGKGCNALPQFNTVIGVCRGDSCACGDASGRSCAPEGHPERCGAVGGRECTGNTTKCCFGANVEPLKKFYDAGSRATLNYIAAYQYDGVRWQIAQDSSFNTDGRYPAYPPLPPPPLQNGSYFLGSICRVPKLSNFLFLRCSYNLAERFGGLPAEEAWLAPQPGGSVFWALGYYPAGVKGVGPPAMMFVMSSEEFWGATWFVSLYLLYGKKGIIKSRTCCAIAVKYLDCTCAPGLRMLTGRNCVPGANRYMLNQITLDRGPASAYPRGRSCPVNDNCWASGNSGEMDFLEPAWNSDNVTATHGYRASYSTQFNQVSPSPSGRGPARPSISPSPKLDPRLAAASTQVSMAAASPPRTICSHHHPRSQRPSCMLRLSTALARGCIGSLPRGLLRSGPV